MSLPSTNKGVVGTYTELGLDVLLLDFNNPRFQLGADVTTQVDIANTLIMSYDVMMVAESIAGTGFFANEPLVAIEETKGLYTVVEGNRRLTALKGLLDSEFRKQLFSPDRWDELAKRASILGLAKIPVIVVNERAKADAIVGYRHISGISQWTPQRQASYIANLVDSNNLEFDAVSKTVGKPRADVAAMYRNYKIALQATGLGFDSSGLDLKFTYLTLAMNAPGLRDFVKAPTGNAIRAGKEPIPTDKLENLKELFGWLYGTQTEAAVVSESRHISKLGKVIQKPIGMEKLRETGDLAAAEEAIRIAGIDPLQRLKNRLQTAQSALDASIEDLADFRHDQSVVDKIAEVMESASALEETLNASDS